MKSFAMSPTNDNEMGTSESSSAVITDDYYGCHGNEEVTTTFPFRQDIRLPNIIAFTISLNEYNLCQSRKRFSVDLQLLSYSFLIRLINRVFHLQSNFTLVAKESSSFKCNFPVTDDFDIDGCMMNLLDENEQQSVLEFIVFKFPRTKDQIQYETEDWCVLENNGYDDNEENFEVLYIRDDSILVTIKPKDVQQETFLQKATGWLHGSVNASSTHCLTKSEFLQMLDPENGRLLDETAFRQRIFDSGCEKSIRKTVWCYLLRVFNESMTNEEKIQYIIKAKERYHAMRQSWQDRYEKDDPEIIALENFIQKDVRRTDRSEKFFDDKENLSQQKLLHILMTYSVYHPEPGYVQGMNDMAAPILCVVHDEALAYACFCALMRHMSPLFHSNGIAMNRRFDLLRKAIRAIDIDLSMKIEQCDIGKLIFTYRWLLLDCKREFPFQDIFRVLETLWASLPIDRFESNNDQTFFEHEDLYSTSMCNHQRSLTIPSQSDTIVSSRSCSPTLEDTQSQHSSLDGGDSGYRDDQVPGLSDCSLRSQKSTHSTYLTTPTTSMSTSCIRLEKWLTHFSSIDDDEHYSDMFTIFLCVALLEQNRSSIMQISPLNGDDDDWIGTYFTRRVRQHKADHALQLARNYHRQYVIFQMRVKQLLSTDA